MPKVKEVMDMIKKHEGYRDKVYKCPAGVPTCGWGHAFHEGSRVPLNASLAFFEQDFKTAQIDAERLIHLYDLIINSVRQAVLTDMMFNLGYAGVKKFKRFIEAMERGLWVLAAAEMLDSKWARQVGARAEYLSQMMHSGLWQKGAY